MNQELIEMARQAGITMSSQYGAQWEANTEDLEAFAVLVAEYSYKKGSAEASADFEAIILPAALAKVAATEREACAKLADEYATWGGSNFFDWFKKLSAAIRARGETK